jgi:hypothetical protein
MINIGLIFRFFCYVFLGLFLEIVVSAINSFFSNLKLNKKHYWFLEGRSYLWMIPVYGFLLLYLFEFVNFHIYTFFIIVRYFIWAIIFTTGEWTSGFIYDKILGRCPWLYEGKYVITGYTKLTLIPLWGIFGLVVEHYSSLVLYLTKYVILFYK